MSKRGWWVLGVMLGLLLTVVTTATVIGWWAWREIHRPYQGYSGEAVVVEIDRGTDAASILHQLQIAGVITDARLARLYLVHRLQDPYLKAGEYRFVGPLSVPEVLDKLIRGDVVTYPVTIIEGLRYPEIAEHLAVQGLGAYDRFIASMSSPDLIADLDPEAVDLEGYLFPDTYRFARGTSEADIVATLVSTFRRLFERDVAPLIDRDRDRTVRQIVTLASIVETEAQLDAERPVIAGVYANRLRRGMLLQADPTVIYALVLAGIYDGNLRRDDLQFDSPYNTYVYPGLPPGPIASPGLASLEAAASPAQVPYLYFVSRNDGSHVFAETLREHNRNVEEWQKAYWRRRWAEERRQKSAVQPPG